MRHLLRFPLFCCFFIFTTLSAQTQRYLEAGCMFGLMNYSGDLTTKRFEFHGINTSYGAFARYQFNRVFALRGHVYGGVISGDDKHSPNWQLRSLRFSSSILELAAAAEINLFGSPRYSPTGVYQPGIRPFFYIGGGIVMADPQAEYYGLPENRNVVLQAPLPEDGPHQNYYIPMVGGGIRFDLLPALVIGVEGGIRPVFDDNLDGVRINGNPDSDDWYYFGGVTASFILSKTR